MKMRGNGKRALAATAALCMTTVWLAGCGSGTKEGKSAAPQAPEPVTLTFFTPVGGATPEKFMSEYGNAIQKKFPHVTTKFVNVDTAKKILLPELLAAGEQIDVIYASVGMIHENVLKNGLAYDMTELAKLNNLDLGKFEPSTIDLIRQISGGALYGIPTSTGYASIVYNKDLFDKFGEAYPANGMTWDELLQKARKMTRNDGGVQYRGFVASFNHLALTNQLSASFDDPKTEKSLINSDNWSKHVQNLARFYDIPGNEVTTTTAALTAQNNFFVKDRVAAMYANVFPLTYLDPDNAATKGMNLDAVSLPEYSDRKGVGSQPYPAFFSLTSISKKKEAAFQVIAWLASEEFQLAQSRKGIQTALKNDKVRSEFGKEFPYLSGKNVSAFMPPKPASPSVVTLYNSVAAASFMTTVHKIVSKQLDVNTGLRQAEEETNKKIAEMKTAAK
ncbi:carbohydrate ABC transporter substrate-binding protein [Paenibacillus mesophilus]|uniref:ABC transporter substrate-binding protein n=1 Tax=Paenibacillus mesophilus TaxID=2582849 RepID=UPI00110EEF6B|nr:ABC transporter substrate-binding protein [Paenibacillus mesophilus]TMV47278.1 carbohydrate ABC transporter substrate-binding protein [Paenibacillus mesophilus]